MKVNKEINVGRSVHVMLTVVAVMLCLVEPAFASSGGGTVGAGAGSLLTQIIGWLKYLAIGTMTIAIIVCGYKYMFGGATMRELGPIFIGGVLISSAAAIAGALLS